MKMESEDFWLMEGSELNGFEGSKLRIEIRSEFLLRKASQDKFLLITQSTAPSLSSLTGKLQNNHV